MNTWIKFLVNALATVCMLSVMVILVAIMFMRL